MSEAPSNLYTQPSGTVRQLSGVAHDSEQPILALLAKRTYQIDAHGRCQIAAEQVPLVEDLVIDDETGVVVHDLDVYLYKAYTDVVVLGHAYAMPGERSFTAGLAVGQVIKSLQVFGDRRCAIGPNGGLLFSEPAPCERIPLSYARAYGGRDAFAEQQYGNPYAPLQPYMAQADLAQASPFLYPRNAYGVGYLIEARPEAVDALVLPNLEDPQDLLRPNNIVVQSPDRWPEMPLPWCTSWVDPSAFPRLACFGAIPEHAPLSQPFTEVRRGFYPPEVFVTTDAAGGPKPIEQRYSPLFSNGASFGLALALRGNEEILLARLHPERERLVVALPGEVPRLWVDGREGKMIETRPRLHSVVIEPDAGRLSMLWCGSAPARRLYMADELPAMPLRVQW